MGSARLQMMRVNFINFLCRSVICREKCRVLSRALTVSSVYQNRSLKNPNAISLRQEIFEESKRDYEDTFGNIDSFEQKFARIKDDPEDILEYQKEKAAQGKRIVEYIKEIKSHLDNHDYASALKVLEVDMVNDKKRLNPFTYKLLINYNALRGNLEEAYRLFLNFKKRGGIPTGAMYTSLFNACANCHNSFLAIQKADAVTESMRKNSKHSINTSNYNAMLKAYGRHGDLSTCLKIVDEVLERRDKVRSDTYNFLFQACISDSNSGLRHAFIIWRKMLQNLVQPDIYTFNLVLRCINECSLGDALLISNIMEDIEKESGKFFKKKVITRTIDGETKRKVLKIPVSGVGLTKGVEEEASKSERKEHDFIQIDNIRLSEPSELGCLDSSESGKGISEEIEENRICSDVELSGVEKNSIIESTKNLTDETSVETEIYENVAEMSTSQKTSHLPNLLALTPTKGDMIDFSVMTNPTHRFMLVGGLKGFLKTMNDFGVKPNIKTLTLLLQVIPPTVEDEEKLLSVAEEYNITLDTTFFNMLMRRRFFRSDDSAAKACLQDMYSLNLKPNLLTFGVLSLGCRTRQEGMELLQVLHNNGYRANTEILGSLFQRARRANDPKYVLDILRAAKEDEVEVTGEFLAKISTYIKTEGRKIKREREKVNTSKEEGETSSDFPKNFC